MTLLCMFISLCFFPQSAASTTWGNSKQPLVVSMAGSLVQILSGGAHEVGDAEEREEDSYNELAGEEVAVSLDEVEDAIEGDGKSDFETRPGRLRLRPLSPDLHQSWKSNQDDGQWVKQKPIFKYVEDEIGLARIGGQESTTARRDVGAWKTHAGIYSGASPYGLLEANAKLVDESRHEDAGKASVWNSIGDRVRDVYEKVNERVERSANEAELAANDYLAARDVLVRALEDFEVAAKRLQNQVPKEQLEKVERLKMVVAGAADLKDQSEKPPLPTDEIGQLGEQKSAAAMSEEGDPQL